MKEQFFPILQSIDLGKYLNQICESMDWSWNPKSIYV